MSEFKKGDFVRIATGKLGVVIGECGNQIMIRLNDLSYCTSFPSGLEKISGGFVPLDLSDDAVRKNLRGVWSQIRYGKDEDSSVIEVPCRGFSKPKYGEWTARFDIGGYDCEYYDNTELLQFVTINGLPVAAVKEIEEKNNG